MNLLTIHEVIIMYDFTDNEIKELNQLRDLQKDCRLKTRFFALILLHRTSDTSIVSEVFKISVSTIERWYGVLKEKGASYLNSFNYTGKKSQLSAEELIKLKSWVSEENPANREVIRRYIAKEFGVLFKTRTISDIMKSLDLKILKPKTLPGEAPSVAIQQEFIGNYFHVGFYQENDPGMIRLFCDGAHLVHQVVPRLCWGDPKNIPVFPTNTSRNRLNILGAYDQQTGDFVHLTSEESLDAERVIVFLEKLNATYAKHHSVILYVDNASYFKARVVREWLEKNPKIYLWYLPTYSPNLNLIERLWRFVKERLVKNRYHSKYKVFRAKVFQLLNHLEQHADKLSSLITENFQIIDPEKLNIKKI